MMINEVQAQSDWLVRCKWLCKQLHITAIFLTIAWRCWKLALTERCFCVYVIERQHLSMYLKSSSNRVMLMICDARQIWVGLMIIISECSVCVCVCRCTSIYIYGYTLMEAHHNPSHLPPPTTKKKNTFYTLMALYQCKFSGWVWGNVIILDWNRFKQFFLDVCTNTFYLSSLSVFLCFKFCICFWTHFLQHKAQSSWRNMV